MRSDENHFRDKHSAQIDFLYSLESKLFSDVNILIESWAMVFLHMVLIRLEHLLKRWQLSTFDQYEFEFFLILTLASNVKWTTRLDGLIIFTWKSNFDGFVTTNFRLFFFLNKWINIRKLHWFHNKIKIWIFMLQGNQIKNMFFLCVIDGNN